MNLPLLSWSIVAGLFAAVVLVRFIRATIACAVHHRSFVSMGSEREEIFIPGDLIRENDNDYNDVDDI